MHSTASGMDSGTVGVDISGVIVLVISDRRRIVASRADRFVGLIVVRLFERYHLVILSVLI
jgi:hypothetical protein